MSETDRMSDANMVPVPRELVDRLLAWTVTDKDLFCDLRACIKPRKVEMRRWINTKALESSFCNPVFWVERPIADGFVLVAVTIEEIL